MPVIMLFCVVGSFAINNTAFDVAVMLIAGVVAFMLEENGFPIAPAILGVVLGGMLEENFVTLDDQVRRQPAAFFCAADRGDARGVMTASRSGSCRLLMRRLRRLAGIEEPA